MDTKRALHITGSVFIAIGCLCFVFGIVRADPADATLTVTVSDRAPQINDVLIVTYTLTAMDPEEAFANWNVRIAYSPTVLAFVPGSCRWNPTVWFSDTFVITSCTATTDDLYIGEMNLAGHSITSTPILLGSSRFTVTAEAPFGFDVITETIGDTNFYRPDLSNWQPGTIRLEGPNAVGLQNLTSHSNRIVIGIGSLLLVAGILITTMKTKLPDYFQRNSSFPANR